MAGRRHPSFVALDECEKQVKITIRNHLDEIATFLKDSNIIDHTLYNDVTNPASREKADDKAIRLYMKLQEMIEGDEDYFFEFVGFLRKNHVFKETVAMLHGAYPGEIPWKSKKCKDIKTPKRKQDDRDYGEFCERVQYVFSIVNANEFNAATTMITAPDIEDGSDVITTINAGVYIGMMGSHPVGLIQHGPGRDCAEILKEGINNFPNAEYLVAVGVCYGFSRVNTELADVLISKQIIDLGPYRISENSIEIRGDHTNMKGKIDSIFCFNATKVNGLQVAQDRYAKHWVGKIASGPNLVDKADFKEMINYQVKPMAYGGEMEGGELLRLQKDGIVMLDGSKKYIQVIVIKAVTDYADGTKNKEWQFIGAQAAFHYVKSKMEIQRVEYPKSVIKKDGIEADGSVELAEEAQQEKPDFTRELNIKDLPTIRDYLYDAKVKWYDIGLALTLGTDDLDDIRDSNAKSADRLRDMLTIWLQRGENRRWSAIIKALESKAVARPDVAGKIK